jgi:VWFA-related protein
MSSLPRLRWIVRTFGVPVLASLCGMAVVATSPRLAAQGRVSRPSDRVMFVSVLNKDGAPVTGLSASDFVVREDGVAREVVRAEKATEPITIAILVDTSQAIAPDIADVRRGLTDFVKRMGGRNPIAIISFGERPTVLTSYTLDIPALEKAVDRLFPTSGSGSYLLQAVADTCHGLAKRDYQRAVILAITAGGPEFSDRNYDEFLPMVRSVGATFDAMVFSREPPNMANFGQRNREMFLDAVTSGTGGERTLLLSSMALNDALSRLAAELADQYRITYGRPETLVPPQKIEVSVRRPGLTARGTPVVTRSR